MKRYSAKVIIGNDRFDRTFTVIVTASGWSAAMARAATAALKAHREHIKSLGNKKRVHVANISVSIYNVHTAPEDCAAVRDRAWFSHGGENA